MNYRGDVWADVGDWFAPDALHLKDDIQFPMGLISAPSAERSSGAGTVKESTTNTETDEEVPLWLIIALIVLGVALRINFQQQLVFV